MKTMILGDSGAQVSELCLGALPFGTKVSEKDSFALMDHYYEAGGRFIDTANNYSMWHPGGKGGESETTIGKWMKERGNRGDMFIATKVGFNTAEVGRSLSKATIMSEIEGSLAKLSVQTVNGNTKIAATLDDDGQYTFKTVNGNCELVLPADFRARVSANGVNLHVDCAQPAQSVRRQFNGRSRTRKVWDSRNVPRQATDQFAAAGSAGEYEPGAD